MSIAQLLNTPATITRSAPLGEEDAYGNEKSKPEEVETVAEFQKRVRRGGEEPEAEGEMSDALWLGIFPVGTELDTSDSVSAVPIGRMEVVGEPWQVHNPRTHLVSHVEVNLRRTAGPGEG